MVCLSSRGPNSEKLLRYASRLAGKLNRNWYAFYVQTPSEEATAIDAQTQRLLSNTLTLAKQLGALVLTYKGEDIADTILRFAREYRVGHIVLGAPHFRPFWKRLGENRNILKNVIKNAKGITVIVLDTREEEPIATWPLAKTPEGMSSTVTVTSKTLASTTDQLVLSQLLSPRRIILCDQPVKKEEILRILVETACKDIAGYEFKTLFGEVMKREEQGSTFLNEGVAFPHVRVNTLTTPIVTLGLTRKGVLGVATGKSIEIIFLILSPVQPPDTQVKVLGLASRAAQNRHLLQNLKTVLTPEDAMNVISNWDMPNKLNTPSLT